MKIYTYCLMLILIQSAAYANYVNYSTLNSREKRSVHTSSSVQALEDRVTSASEKYY